MAEKFNLVLQNRPILENGDTVRLAGGQTGNVVGSEVHELHKDRFSFHNGSFYKVLTKNGELRLISKMQVDRSINDGGYVQHE